MTDVQEKAQKPEDITRLIVERMNAGDADGIAALYSEDAVMAFPPGQTTVGRAAIRAIYQGMIEKGIRFAPEQPLPTLRLGDIALTATPARDEAAARAQVVRRERDGSWVRVLDRPDFRG
jgi:uncharacterized protein (TIGR02246 family)